MTVIGLWIDNINLKRVDNFAKEKYLKVIDDIFKNIEIYREGGLLWKHYHPFYLTIGMKKGMIRVE